MEGRHQLCQCKDEGKKSQVWEGPARTATKATGVRQQHRQAAVRPVAQTPAGRQGKCRGDGTAAALRETTATHRSSPGERAARRRAASSKQGTGRTAQSIWAGGSNGFNSGDWTQQSSRQGRRPRSLREVNLTGYGMHLPQRDICGECGETCAPFPRPRCCRRGRNGSHQCRAHDSCKGDRAT